MDFRFTEEQENFRQEVRDFLHRELPSDWPFNGRLAEESDEWWDFTLSWLRKLGGKGWIALTWPEEYGGKGRPLMDEVILSEEMAYRRTPGVQVWARWKMVAPIIMGLGSEEQKKRHLPGIAKGEVTWCEGFSEPGAGSDLASLQLRAEEQKDSYILNGQKLFTSGAHRSDWMFLLARTDPEAMPQRRGISFFLMDMKTPGITVRPLVNLANIDNFNEVFFDNARVPKENLVGEKNRGWYVAMALLNIERSAAGIASWYQRLQELLVQFVRETKRHGVPLARDPIIRHKLAEAAIEAQIARMISYRVACMQSQGLEVTSEGAMINVYGMELMQRLANMGLQILGLYGQLEPGSKWAQLGGVLERDYLYNTGLTIGAGTSEIQRLVIAIWGLGLPRA